MLQLLHGNVTSIIFTHSAGTLRNSKTMDHVKCDEFISSKRKKFLQFIHEAA